MDLPEAITITLEYLKTPEDKGRYEMGLDDYDEGLPNACLVNRQWFYLGIQVYYNVVPINFLVLQRLHMSTYKTLYTKVIRRILLEPRTEGELREILRYQLHSLFPLEHVTHIAIRNAKVKTSCTANGMESWPYALPYLTNSLENFECANYPVPPVSFYWSVRYCCSNLKLLRVSTYTNDNGRSQAICSLIKANKNLKVFWLEASPRPVVPHSWWPAPPSLYVPQVALLPLQLEKVILHWCDLRFLPDHIGHDLDWTEVILSLCYLVTPYHLASSLFSRLRLTRTVYLTAYPLDWFAWDNWAQAFSSMLSLETFYIEAKQILLPELVEFVRTKPHLKSLTVFQTIRLPYSLPVRPLRRDGILADVCESARQLLILQIASEELTISFGQLYRVGAVCRRLDQLRVWNDLAGRTLPVQRPMPFAAYYQLQFSLLSLPLFPEARYINFGTHTGGLGRAIEFHAPNAVSFQ